MNAKLWLLLLSKFQIKFFTKKQKKPNFTLLNRKIFSMVLYIMLDLYIEISAISVTYKQVCEIFLKYLDFLFVWQVVCEDGLIRCVKHCIWKLCILHPVMWKTTTERSIFKLPPVVLISFHQTYNQTFNLIYSKVLMLYAVIELMKVTCLDQITKQRSVCGGAKSEASHRC